MPDMTLKVTALCSYPHCLSALFSIFPWISALFYRFFHFVPYCCHNKNGSAEKGRFKMVLRDRSGRLLSLYDIL